MIKQCVLLGSGASIREGIDKDLWNKIKGQNIWSLNYAWLTMPYLPKRELFVDNNFFKDNVVKLQELAEKGVEVIGKFHSKNAYIDKITKYKTTREKAKYFGKESIKKNLIFRGAMGLVGMFALSLAIAEGYNEIYLLGYDFGTVSLEEKFTHYYQDKLNVKSSGVGRPIVYRTPKNEIKKQVSDFDVFLREKDVNIYNVSLMSNIPFYKKISYEEFFKCLNG